MKQKLLLLVCLFGLLMAVSGPLHAQAVTEDPIENEIQSVTDSIDQLLDTHINALDEVGSLLLAWIILVRLVAAVNDMRATESLEPVIQVLLLSMFTALCMTYYSRPLPGSEYSLHQIPSYLAKLISATFDMTVIDDFYNRFYDVMTLTEKPDIWNISGIFVFLLVQAIMLTMDLVVFVVNSWSFVGLGVTTLFGKLLIPTLLTKHFNGKFYGWLDLLVGFAMLRAVANAMSALWGGIVIQFLDRSVAGDYSLVHWDLMAGALVLVSGGFIYGLIKVPWLSERLFGGMGGAVEGFGRSVGAYVSRTVAAYAV